MCRRELLRELERNFREFHAGSDTHLLSPGGQLLYRANRHDRRRQRRSYLLHQRRDQPNHQLHAVHRTDLRFDHGDSESDLL